jgi:hypothetical protein
MSRISFQAGDREGEAVSVGELTEPELAIVEIEFIHADNSFAILRMNVFVARELAAKIEAVGG